MGKRKKEIVGGGLSFDWGPTEDPSAPVLDEAAAVLVEAFEVPASFVSAAFVSVEALPAAELLAPTAA